MARYTGAVCRQCRREGQKLFLKGDRCYTDKCAIERRPYAPGMHNQGRTKKLSEYGMQLRHGGADVYGNFGALGFGLRYGEKDPEYK